ncbi:MAG TPA: sensor domain-containing diguanylate cyclase [Nitrospiria bacterium]|nr:sensor domain-containing diguanylate cyclase [Nitrospiria bacterium]
MKELQALLDISKSLPTTQSRQEVLYLLVKAIAGAVDVTRCSVILVDEESSKASVLATFEDSALREIPIDLHKYPEIQEAVATASMVLVEDVERDARMQEVAPLFRHLQIASILVIPIMFYERVLGTLFLRTSRPHSAFTREEILFCETASYMAANFLLGMTQYQFAVEEKARLAEEAMRDPLTGLGNRSSFSRALSESIAYARRHQRPLACLMIDADNFKSINDRFGHHQGDHVLRGVADAITNALRESDLAARYGGDEFAVLLRDTDGPGAFIKAERIRDAVRYSRLVDGADPVTVSIGIAVWNDLIGLDPDYDLVAEADRALYAAKGHGKNRTVPTFSEPSRPAQTDAA